MRRLRPSLVLLLVVVTLVAALAAMTRRPLDPIAVAATGSLLAETSDTARSGMLPVSSRTLVCPDGSALAEGGSTDVTLVAPRLLPLEPGAAASAGGSSASAQPLGTDATPLAVLTDQGPAATAMVQAPDLGPVVVRTVGALAGSLSASQLGTAGAGDVTGVAAVTCDEPSTEAWFLGIGTELGHRPRLSLVNTEQAAAELDVTLYGAAGPLDIASLRGVVVPAGGSETFELDAVAPDLPELAIEVQVTSGRVAAAVRDSRVEGLSSWGVDWVPRSVPPSTRVVVPGVTGGEGERLLQLLAPGDLDTRVQVRLWTRTGALVPVGLEEIDLAAGVVSAVDLASVLVSELGPEVAAVELTGDQPIVASLRAVTSGVEQREMAYTAGSAPLVGPAVVADARAGAGWTARLVLSADDGGPDSATLATDEPPAHVRVFVRLVDAESGAVVGSAQPVIPAGSTVEVPLTGDGLPERFSVIVMPAAGAVYGALALERGGGPDAGITLLPLSPPQLLVEVSAVRHDPLTVLRFAG